MNYGLDMQLRYVFEDEECAAAFDRLLPGLRPVFEKRREALGMSVRTVAGYTKGMFPQKTLEALETELKVIGERNHGISSAERRRMEHYQLMREEEQAGKKQSVAQVHHQDAVYPGKAWLDVSGRRIQAHAGGFLYENGIYYWYGENKEYTDGESEIWTWGIRLYSSRDFYNWEDKGLIIPPDVENPGSELYPEKRVDRPHILRNPTTGKYICWIKNSGGDACFNVLIADSLMGSWKMVNEHYNPFGLHVGDFDIICEEESGRAYLYCEANHRQVVGFRLNADFTEAEKIISRQYEGMNPPFTREGVTVFQRRDKLWMLTSGMTGYVPNQSDSAVSGNFEEPFVSVGDPHVDDPTLSSFNSQISQVFKVPGKKNLYLAVADRWVPGYPLDRERALAIRRASASHYDPEHFQPTGEDKEILASAPMLDSANTSIADYVILPIEFADEQPRIFWRDKWKLDEYE